MTTLPLFAKQFGNLLVPMIDCPHNIDTTEPLLIVSLILTMITGAQARKMGAITNWLESTRRSMFQPIVVQGRAVVLRVHVSNTVTLCE